MYSIYKSFIYSFNGLPYARFFPFFSLIEDLKERKQKWKEINGRELCISILLVVLLPCHSLSSFLGFKSKCASSPGPLTNYLV